ncbi:MAG: CapA family protein [Eubacterium sp.]|nr:CapA family protein [Eubacterium sp.]
MNFKELKEKSKAFKVTVKIAPGVTELVWDAVEHADGYRIFSSPHGKNVFRGQTSVTDTSVRFSGCKNGVPVDYKVKAFRTADGPDNFFAESYQVTACPMATPSEIQVKYGADSTPSLYWDNSDGCDGYKIYTSQGDGDFEFAAYCPSAPYTFIGGALSKPINVKVRAFRVIDGAEKLSNFSDAVQITPSAEKGKARAAEKILDRPARRQALDGESRYSENNGTLTNNIRKCTIVIGGDISTSKAVQREAYNCDKSFDFAFSYIKSLFTSSDFSIAALDTELNDDMLYTYEDESVNNCPSFLADSFKRNGLDAAVLNRSAKNAAKVLEKYPVSVISSDTKAKNRRNCITADISGIKTAFVTVSVNSKTADSAIKAARDGGAEYVIVFCDWNDRHSPVVKPAWRSYAEKLAAAGADFIIGTGVNSLCEYDVINSGEGREVPVAYSLGCIVSNNPATRFENIGALICVTLQKDSEGVSLSRTGYFPYAMRPRGAARVAVPLFDSNRNRFTRAEFDALLNDISEKLGEKIEPARRTEKPRKVSFALNGSSLISGLFAGCENVVTDRSHLFISQFAICGDKRKVEKRYYADAPTPLYYTLSKGFSEYLSENKSEYLILDLYYAAASALYEMDGVVYSGGRQFIKSAFYKENKAKLKQLDFSRESIWKRYLDEYIKAITAAYPSGKIIIVKVSDPCLYDSNTGLIAEQDVSVNFRLLAAMQDYFIQKARPYIIDVPRYFCGKANKAGACYAINRSEEYSQYISQMALSAARGDADPRTGGSFARLWLTHISDNFDEIRRLKDKSFFFDKNGIADHIISRTSGEFISMNFNDLARLKDSGFPTFTELLTRFDFGGNALLETVCRAINSLRRKKLEDENISVLINLGLAASDDIVSALEAFYNEQGIIPDCRLTERNLDFYLKCARMYITGKNKTAVSRLVTAFYEKNKPAMIDMWGDSLMSRIVRETDAAVPGARLVDCSALTAFCEKPKADLSYIDRGSTYYKELCGSFTDRLGKTGDWILIDFSDVILPVCQSGTAYYSLIAGFESSNFFKAFCKDDIKTVPYEDGIDSELVKNALEKTAAFLKEKYGDKIILGRFDLKLNYIDLDGTIKPFSDEQVEIKNRFIRAFEDEFIRLTDCYVIDLSDKFIADRSSCRSKPSSSAYEKLYYTTAAAAVEDIVTGKADKSPQTKVDIVSYIQRTEKIKEDNPDMSAELLRQICGGMYELIRN